MAHSPFTFHRNTIRRSPTESPRRRPDEPTLESVTCSPPTLGSYMRCSGLSIICSSSYPWFGCFGGVLHLPRVSSQSSRRVERGCSRRLRVDRLTRLVDQHPQNRFVRRRGRGFCLLTRFVGFISQTALVQTLSAHLRFVAWRSSALDRRPQPKFSRTYSSRSRRPSIAASVSLSAALSSR